MGNIPSIEASEFVESYAEICTLLDNQFHDKAAFNAVIDLAARLEGIRSATLFLYTSSRTPSREIVVVAHCGPDPIPEPVVVKAKSSSWPAVHSVADTGPVLRYFKFTALGKTAGWLGTAGDSELCSTTDHALRALAHLAAMACEKPQASARLKHASNKLEMHSELNKLIASGANLERLSRAIAREAAFRFGASCALVVLMSEAQKQLDIVGSYGCPPQSLPEKVDAVNTQISRSLRLGGMISVPDLRSQQDHGLGFLVDMGFLCVHWSSIEIRDEVLGAVLIGYRDRRELSDLDRDMLEEFTRSAAVAIINTRNKDKLANYTSILEDLVEERTHDLAVQKARADEANLAKSRFVANMSHELRSPLTAIFGYASVIAEGIFGPITSEQEDGLSSIARAADHLKELINDVLDISKVEAGKEETDPKEIEVYKLMVQVHRLMMQTAMGKGVEIVPISVPQDEQAAALKVRVDPRHIRQILLNLLSNAVKYTPPSGKVSLYVEQLGDKAKISVTDTGVGIPAQEAEKLFERFYRGDDGYSRTQVGTGIGLSLTKKLVEMNGGKIGFESEVGKGSTFWILIPLAEEKIAGDDGMLTASERPTLLQHRLDGLNVLIVDDNQSTCEVLKTIIKSVGGMPYVAYSVAEARRISDNASLDAALVDLAIPGENGLVLLDYFRKRCEPPLSTMPLIVISACVFAADRQEAMNHGASAFIAKPFDPTRVVSAIRDLTTAAAIEMS